MSSISQESERSIRQNVTNVVLDKALTNNTTLDHLLRLKAVEMAVYFFIGKSPTEVMFHEAYNKIYKFYNNEQTTSQLRERSLPEEES